MNRESKRCAGLLAFGIGFNGIQLVAFCLSWSLLSAFTFITAGRWIPLGTWTWFGFKKNSFDFACVTRSLSCLYTVNLVCYKWVPTLALPAAKDYTFKKQWKPVTQTTTYYYTVRTSTSMFTFPVDCYTLNRLLLRWTVYFQCSFVDSAGFIYILPFLKV